MPFLMRSPLHPASNVEMARKLVCAWANALSLARGIDDVTGLSHFCSRPDAGQRWRVSAFPNPSAIALQLVCFAGASGVQAAGGPPPVRTMFARPRITFGRIT